MDQILSLIDQYGTAVYFIIFAYCAFKSGLLPVFAGFAAQQGVLDPFTCAMAAVSGGYLGDELRFKLARHYGTDWAHDRPTLLKWITRAKRLLEIHGPAYIFIYRYPKGLRTVGALPVGLTQMPWAQFTVLNLASAASWGTLMVGLGFVFGQSLESAIQNGWGLISVMLLIGFALVTWLAWKQIAKLDEAG